MSTVILGGGIGGLSVGYYMLRLLNQRPIIYEAALRVGGWIRTETHKEHGGFLLEAGPRTIRPKGPAGANTLEMIETLKLPIKPIPADHVAARNRMVYAKGRLCLLPNSPGALFKVLPPFTQPLYKALIHDMFAGARKSELGDESIYEFVQRRLGTELADYAISPMICGICAGDAKEISVRFLMDGLYEKEQRYGGILKGLLRAKFAREFKEAAEGLFATQHEPALYERACKEKWAMYGVEGGLEQLPRALRKFLQVEGAPVQLAHVCKRLTFDGREVHLTTNKDETKAAHVVSALPAHKLATLVREQHPQLAAELAAIQYVDVAVVNLQYASADLLGLPGFGLLVPPIERLPILGIIFDSCCFEMSGNTVLTVMLGGKWFEEHFGQQPSCNSLLTIAQEHVRKILGIEAEATFCRVNTLPKCIPQYVVGHQQRVRRIRDYISQNELPLSVCGAAYDGVGINDVILSARRQVEDLAKRS